MASYKKLGKDVLLMTIGNFGSKLLTFVFVPFYTAKLSTSEYGTADLISTTITLLFPFFSLIICESMMRFALDEENNSADVWKIGIKITLTGMAAFAFLSPIILITPLKNYYWYVVAYYITYCFNMTLSYFVRGLNKVRIFAIGGIVQTGVVVLTSLLFLLWLDLGIDGYLLAHILGSIASILYMYFSARIYKYGMSLKSEDSCLHKKMLSYSLPMIPNSASWWLADASSKFFLTAFIGTAATGLFSVANKIPHIISTVAGILGNALKINVVEDFGSESSKEFFSDYFSKKTTILFLMIAIMLLLNKPLAAILFSNDFYQAWQFVPLLLFSSMMHAYSESLGSIYTASYKTNFLVISTAIGAAVNVALNLTLIPIVGIIGAAIAVAVAQSVICISRLINSRRILKVKMSFGRNAICCLIILMQIVIASNEYKYEYAYSTCALILIVFIQRVEIANILKSIMRKVFHKRA